MILKIDHIAFTCQKAEVTEIMKMMEDWHPLFYEKHLKNLEIKKPFMRYWQEDHDIILLNSDRHFPVEITAYEHVAQSENKYEVLGDTVTVNTSSIERSKAFYHAIGFKEEGSDRMTLKTVMDQMQLAIKLRIAEKTQDSNYSLDTYGYCCLAFVTNNARREKNRLEKNAIKTTEIIRFRVNGRDMDIFFAWNPLGDMCEFICPLNLTGGQEYVCD